MVTPLPIEAKPQDAASLLPPQETMREILAKVIEAEIPEHARRLREGAGFSSSDKVTVRQAIRAIAYALGQSQSNGVATHSPATVDPTGILKAARKMLAVLYTASKDGLTDAFAELEVACNIAERKALAAREA